MTRELLFTCQKCGLVWNQFIEHFSDRNSSWTCHCGALVGSQCLTPEQQEEVAKLIRARNTSRVIRQLRDEKKT